MIVGEFAGLFMSKMFEELSEKLYCKASLCLVFSRWLFIV